MTCSEFYTELKGWQTVIGSVLGFLALMGGALFNAHLNRKRDDRMRIAEAKVIALSLYSEINLLRSEAASLANGIGGWFTRGGHGKDEPPDYYKELFSPREPTLYNALASKIGLLEVGLLLPVTKFYSDYEEAAGHFPKLFENERRGISYGVEWVLGPAISAVEGVESAVRRIEAIGKICEPVATPQVKKGREALALAEEMKPDHD